MSVLVACGGAAQPATVGHAVASLPGVMSTAVATSDPGCSGVGPKLEGDGLAARVLGGAAALGEAHSEAHSVAQSRRQVKQPALRTGSALPPTN